MADSNKPPKDFDLLKAIRNESIYKSSIERRDKSARKIISENLKPNNKTVIFPGQLIMFDYFEPSTKDQLEYYDAMPCTIFFGIINTDNGKRVIGFNLHYFPPKMRYQIINRIFEIFKPMYLEAWQNPLEKEISYFNYKMIMEQLQRAHLEFGIREYIPDLMNKIIPIPVKYWSKVVFTEGRFKKRTREQIIHYWHTKFSSNFDKKTKKTK